MLITYKYKSYLSILFLSVLFCFKATGQQKRTCAQCHDDILKYEVKHKIPDNDCKKCHSKNNNSHPLDEGIEFTLSEAGNELCFKCHEDTRSLLNLESVHKSFKENCVNCHNPHSSNNSFLLIEKASNLCFSCHEDFNNLFKKSKSSHLTFSNNKGCSNCHKPHASENEHLLKEKGNELCFSCHDKTIKTETQKIENIAQTMKNGTFVHLAIEKEGCATCHTHHYSEFNHLLTNSYPEKKYTNAEPKNFALCFKCHDSNMLKDEYTITATNFRDGDVNMHFLHTNGAKGRTCSLCHNVHASKNEHLINENSLFGKWEMPMNYKFTKTGGSCYPGCHSEKEYVR